jgi:hypothetical protein
MLFIVWVALASGPGSDVAVRYASTGWICQSRRGRRPVPGVGLDNHGVVTVLKPESFLIDKIYVPVKRWKTLKSELVQEIAESILQVGQQTPILVRADEDRFVLVEGLHRLEACKALGETTIIGRLVPAQLAQQKAPSPHEAEAEAEREKMARLRKLRLEKEAAEKLAAAESTVAEPEPAEPRRERPRSHGSDEPKARLSRSGRRASDAKPKSLTEWFDKQEREGYRY